MAEEPELATQDQDNFRAPLPVSERRNQQVFKTPGNVNQNNATSYSSSYTTEMGLNNVDSNVPVQPSNSWPLCPPNPDERGSVRNPPGISRPPQHDSQYEQYTTHGGSDSDGKYR